jgi:hypothetical protein
MRFIHRTISSLILSAALVAPTVAFAAARPQEASVQVRVYDRDHKDYHNWDDREDHAYRAYLIENHRSYREYGRQNRAQQRAYWNWRHEHPDHD